MVDEFARGYDPDVGDEWRYGDVPVKPCSVIKTDLSGSTTEDIGEVPGVEQDAKLLYATIDTTGGSGTAGGDIIIEDSGGTTLFTSASADTADLEIVGPASGEEVISVDETLDTTSSDAGVVARVSVYYTTA